jgi:hypothetical protein
MGKDSYARVNKSMDGLTVQILLTPEQVQTIMAGGQVDMSGEAIRGPRIKHLTVKINPQSD